ncbi:MAG: hypothetical protein IJC84_01355 [Clostridia bacterium]|nr:hypothetical protein [Clostridia bacterium]
MKQPIDLLIALEVRNNCPMTKEQMRRMDFGIYKDFVDFCMNQGYLQEYLTKTSLGIANYVLSPKGRIMAIKEIERRNKK